MKRFYKDILKEAKEQNRPKWNEGLRLALQLSELDSMTRLINIMTIVNIIGCIIGIIGIISIIICFMRIIS